ncbi:MAG: hypothetical protein D6691_06430 [Candidatus Hydrogenedentota bacterium]|nr:MAG: hypothetical protein D6691_06430 [Candidatus Hydrogenedentota bacterium]
MVVSRPDHHNAEHAKSREPTTPLAHDHIYYETLLERHLDGELSANERDELFEHLETCEECRQILEAEELLIENLTRIPRLQPPADLRARILSEVAREREQMMQPFAPLEDDEEMAPSTGHLRAPTPMTVAISLFVAAASVVFFLTADFRAVPPLSSLQQSLRRLIFNAAAEFADFVRPASAPLSPPPAIPPAAETMGTAQPKVTAEEESQTSLSDTVSTAPAR